LTAYIEFGAIALPMRINDSGVDLTVTPRKPERVVCRVFPKGVLDGVLVRAADTA
jgi:hypothetical protein